MATIIPGGRRGSFANILTEGLGGLVSGVMEAKQEQAQRGQFGKALRTLMPNLSPEESESLLNLPTPVLSQYLKGQQQAPANAAFADAIQKIIGGGQQPQAPIGAQQTPQEYRDPQQGAQQGAVPGEMPSVQGLDRQGAFQLAQLALQKQQADQRADLKRQAMDRADQRYDREQELKQKISDRDFSYKERAEAYKLTKTERDAIIKGAETAREQFFDLDRLDKLNKEGKLDTPGYVESLSRMGLDIPSLLNPESQEFQKVSQGFMRGVKEIVGGRVSNVELEQFMKTIPTLSQSPEGRNRVISNMKRLSKIKMKEAKIARELTKENFGIPPLDLKEDIYERMDKELEKFAQEFSADLEKPVPQGQNKFITALQASLGSVVGSGSKVIGGVGSLAGIGKLAGLF